VFSDSDKQLIKYWRNKTT